VKELMDAINVLSADRCTKIETRAQALIAEEMTLRDLRRAQDLTQFSNQDKDRGKVRRKRTADKHVANCPA